MSFLLYFWAPKPGLISVGLTIAIYKNKCLSSVMGRLQRLTFHLELRVCVFVVLI